MLSNCVIYKGRKDKDGYGVVSIKSTTIKAHRLSYLLASGKTGRDIKNFLVCHKCDNPSCINPEHLFLGTPKDNVQDALRKGRIASHKITHCRKGHKYTKDNTYFQPSKRSGNRTRVCRECKRMRERVNYHRNKPI